MKALVRKKYGPYDSLHWMEVPKPEIGPKELLIKVHCNTISRTDCGLLEGKPYLLRFFSGWPRPRKKILGSDFAGEIIDIGSEVSKFRRGEKVFGFNDIGLGSQAEYLALSEHAPIEHIPGQHSYREAVSSIEGGHYALNMLRPLKLQKGSKVLVIGATGAIGSAAIQILRARGIRVDAVGPEAYRDYWQVRGVESYWDYKKQDFCKAKRKYAHVIDAVGKSHFFKCRKLLLQNGVYVSSELGPFASNVWLSWFGFFMPKGKVAFPIPKNIPASLKEMQSLMGSGKFEGLIDPTKINPRQAKSAYQYAGSGTKIGNLLLEWHQD
jgi:NADPH:quinone reductase-like Zn-dependent oxidoreductase